VRGAYDLAISVVEDDAATETTFDNIIKEMLSEEIDEDAYQHQLAYICRVKKANSLNDEPLSVNMFCQRIRVILKRMTFFPGAPAMAENILDGEELAYTIFYAMATAHQQKWKEKGVGAFSNALIKTLLKHFQILWELDRENKGKLNNHLEASVDDRKRGFKSKAPSGSTPNKRPRGNNGTWQLQYYTTLTTRPNGLSKSRDLTFPSDRLLPIIDWIDGWRLSVVSLCRWDFIHSLLMELGLHSFFQFQFQLHGPTS
jgi:hypothetical protein